MILGACALILLILQALSSFQDKLTSAFRPFKSKIVEIKVGPSEETLYAHRDILMARSPFFKGCLRNACKESNSNTVKLPTDDPETFNSVLKWMYGYRHNIDKNVGPAETKYLIKAWVMGDKLCMEEMRNDFMDSIKNQYKYWTVQYYILELVEELVPQPSHLRTFFVKQMAVDLARGEKDHPENEKSFESDAIDFFQSGSTMVAEIVYEMREGIKQDPSHGPSCIFHDHVETEPCQE